MENQFDVAGTAGKRRRAERAHRLKSICAMGNINGRPVPVTRVEFIKNSFHKKKAQEILLYGFLGRHMAAGIKSVGRWTGVNVESWFDSHAERHHWA